MTIDEFIATVAFICRFDEYKFKVLQPHIQENLVNFKIEHVRFCGFYYRSICVFLENKMVYYQNLKIHKLVQNVFLTQ